MGLTGQNETGFDLLLDEPATDWRPGRIGRVAAAGLVDHANINKSPASQSALGAPALGSTLVSRSNPTVYVSRSFGLRVLTAP